MAILKSLLARITGADASIETVGRRFLRVFRDHGIEPSQIPRVLPKIQLSDLQDEKALISALSPEILDQVALLFGIRVQWLEGVDDRIYDHLACYKRPATILEHVESLVKNEQPIYQHPLRALCLSKSLDNSSGEWQPLTPVVVEEIAQLGDEKIYRYRVYQDGFSWDHLPARMELKAIARTIFQQLRLPVPLYEISREEMDLITEGKMIPSFLRTACFLSYPSLEDYASALDECGVAREVEELPSVFRYIEEQKLENYSFFPEKPQVDVHQSDLDQGVESDWRDIARSTADEIHDIDIRCGAYDSVKGIADRVSQRMRERGVFGPRGPLSSATILREALQGGKWKRKSRGESGKTGEVG